MLYEITSIIVWFDIKYMKTFKKMDRRTKKTNFSIKWHYVYEYQTYLT